MDILQQKRSALVTSGYNIQDSHSFTKELLGGITPRESMEERQGSRCWVTKVLANITSLAGVPALCVCCGVLHMIMPSALSHVSRGMLCMIAPLMLSYVATYIYDLFFVPLCLRCTKEADRCFCKRCAGRQEIRKKAERKKGYNQRKPDYMKASRNTHRKNKVLLLL